MRHYVAFKLRLFYFLMKFKLYFQNYDFLPIPFRAEPNLIIFWIPSNRYQMHLEGVAGVVGKYFWKFGKYREMLKPKYFDKKS